MSEEVAMLKIRKVQVEVFEQAAVQNFQDRMLEHLKRFAPKHFKILTEDEMRQVIRHGMDRAESHQFTSERSIRLYIELMLLLGSGFDADPQLPWAAEMLNAEAVPDEAERIDRLTEKAWEFVDHIVPDFGEVDGDVNAQRFIEQIRQLRKEPEEILDTSAVPQFYQRAIGRLNHTFPRKCEYVGELGVRRLINRAIELAKSYQITTERGAAFFVAIMFVLGSGFDKDPQLPWTSAILNDQTIADQNERVNRLFTGAIDCLQRWWA